MARSSRARAPLSTADHKRDQGQETMSYEAAERVVKERVGGLGPNEVIRVRNARGEFVLSTGSTE
jgi:hypothetical protein